MTYSYAGFIGGRKLRSVNSRKVTYFSRTYHTAGNAIETHEHRDDFKER